LDSQVILDRQGIIVPVSLIARPPSAAVFVVLSSWTPLPAKGSRVFRRRGQILGFAGGYVYFLGPRKNLVCGVYRDVSVMTAPTRPVRVRGVVLLGLGGKSPSKRTA
jgi:hypothetical protein